MTSLAVRGYLPAWQGWFLFGVVCGACSGDHGPAADPRSSAPVPVLELRATFADIDASPRGTNTPILLSHSGRVGYAARLASGKQIVVLDSLGAVVGEVGPVGSGPGEVRSPMPFLLNDSILRAVDLVGLRVTTWSLDGRAIRTDQLTEPILPQLEMAGTWLGMEVGKAGFSPVAASNDGRPVWRPVPHASPLVDSLLDAARASKSRPGVGLWEGGFIIADGHSYRIAVLDSLGNLVHRYARTLPPNLPDAAVVEEEVSRLRGLKRNGKRRYDEARLAVIEDSLRTTPREWFGSVSPAAVDGAGRLWVLGVRSDSVFADVFDPDGFIGRLMLPCEGFDGRWSVSGLWLAMLCSPQERGLSVDAEARLYRIGS